LPKNSVFLLFHTIHDVLRAEKIMKERSAAYELVPVPRNLSSDCGMAIRLDDDPKDIGHYLSGIQIAGRFSFDGANYKRLDP